MGLLPAGHSLNHTILPHSPFPQLPHPNLAHCTQLQAAADQARADADAARATAAKCERDLADLAAAYASLETHASSLKERVASLESSGGVEGAFFGVEKLG